MEQEIIHFASRFAKEGYYVFPLYSSDGVKALKPYGWARNEVTDPQKRDKVIPATKDLEIIARWPEIVADLYNGASVVQYGVMGLSCVIFDLDMKDGKDGVAEYKLLQEAFQIPRPELVIKSKSGGYHLYYSRPERMRAVAVKSVSGLVVNGVKYPGVDVRGDGGMVIGPLSEAPEAEWEAGRYQLVKGDPTTELSEIPHPLMMAMSKSSLQNENVQMVAETLSTDELDVLKRGEIPAKLSNGNRNSGFYIYLNALRNKGISADSARRYVLELIKVTENPDTLRDSVDVEDMIARIWRVDLNNPYDVCRDLIELGLYRLTSYRSKLTYVILNENAYIDSRSPHDLPSMKQLMARYSRKMSDANGKQRVVNPADMIDTYITSDREVATIGFKPGASEVFTLTESYGGKRYLNEWMDPRKHIDHGHADEQIWAMFKFIVSRVFGPEGSNEYQLGLDFPAYLIQRPGIKPVVTPFLVSKRRGVGKSLYLWLLGQLFGYNKRGELQARQYKVEEITNRFFNSSSSSLLMFDEVQFPVHKNMRQEAVTFWKHLQSLITLDTLPVEFKGGDVGVQMPNFAGVIMAGNQGHNFPFEECDRRVWLIDNNAPELEEGVVDLFFSMQKNLLTRDQKRHIIGALLHHLNEHKIKLPLDRMRAPDNDIKREMYFGTLTDIEEWWITYFEDKENLLARTPILNKSAILYLIGIAERLANSRWREDPEGTFRELKRRGLIQPIRVQNNNYQTRNLRQIPIVRMDGAISQEGDGRDILYTTRNHGDHNDDSNEAIVQAFISNINGISMWRKKSMADKASRIAGSMSS